MARKIENQHKNINVWIVITALFLVGVLLLFKNPQLMKSNNANLRTTLPSSRPMWPTPLPSPKVSQVSGGTIKYESPIFDFQVTYPDKKYVSETTGFELDRRTNAYYPVITIKSRGESPCTRSQCNDFEIQIGIRETGIYGPFENFDVDTYKKSITTNGIEGFQTDTQLDPITNQFSIKLPKDNSSFYTITAIYQTQYQKAVDQIISSFEIL